MFTQNGGENMRHVCEIEGCENTNIAAKGLCWKHYRRMLRHDNTDDPDYVNSGKTCIIEGCDESAKLEGMCRKHYSRLKRNGNPTLLTREENYKDGDTCLINGCNERPRSHRLCHNHYHSYRYHVRKGNLDNVDEYVKRKNETNYLFFKGDEEDEASQN